MTHLINETFNVRILFIFIFLLFFYYFSIIFLLFFLMRKFVFVQGIKKERENILQNPSTSTI